MSTLSQNDSHRPYPDSADDEQMDLAEAAWVAMCEADDAVQDAEQAERVMSEDAGIDDAAELDEAIRIAREEADAAEQEYDRLVAYRTRRTVGETLNAIATGNMNAVDAVASIFTRRVG